MFSLSIKGSKKLNKKLNNMKLGVARKIVRPALHSALVPVVQTAKALAPVESGRLKKTIKSFVKSSRRRGAIGQVRTGTRRQLRIPPDSKYYYPAAIEYGTRHMAARSFLRSALGRQKNRALKILGREIDQRLRKI